MPKSDEMARWRETQPNSGAICRECQATGLRNFTSPPNAPHRPRHTNFEMRAPIFRTTQCLCRVPAQPSTVVRFYPAAIRPFSSTSTTASGHSRWSKIKHDKGKADARRGASYSKLSQEVTYASREGGLDTKLNLRLKAAIEAAKKG
jgi:hypothetical protein